MNDIITGSLTEQGHKGDILSMEYPLFSISRQIDTEPAIYKFPERGLWIEVIPGANGRANQMDKSLLLYTAGQYLAARSEGGPITNKIRINGHHYLTSTKQGIGGKDYERLEASIMRLKTTTFKTNIAVNGLIDSKMSPKKVTAWSFFDNVEYEVKGDYITGIIITLSERTISALENKKILTYSPAYYALTSPLARRVYELCRKHCGKQHNWQCGLQKFRLKTGSQSSLKEFLRMMKKITADNAIPEYHLAIVGEGRNASVLCVRKSALSKHEKCSVTEDSSPESDYADV